jgi:5'-nucleotidase
MSFEGQPLDMNASYRVTVADFLANGGDTFFTFTKGTNRTTGPLDLAALEAWLGASPPRALPEDNRDKDLRPDLSPALARAPAAPRRRGCIIDDVKAPA